MRIIDIFSLEGLRKIFTRPASGDFPSAKTEGVEDFSEHADIKKQVKALVQHYLDLSKAGKTFFHLTMEKNTEETAQKQDYRFATVYLFGDQNNSPTEMERALYQFFSFFQGLTNVRPDNRPGMLFFFTDTPVLKREGKPEQIKISPLKALEELQDFIDSKLTEYQQINTVGNIKINNYSLGLGEIDVPVFPETDTVDSVYERYKERHAIVTVQMNFLRGVKRNIQVIPGTDQPEPDQ